MLKQNINLRALGAAASAWLIPGLGHVSLGHATKGLVFSTVICLLLIAGVYTGGHFQSLAEPGILAKVFWFCNVGNGLLYLIPSSLGVAVQDQPMQQFSEYGNIYLVAAGLLNYFLMLDAYDTAVGRKQ